MYELKKVGEVFTSKFVGTGPSSYEKKNLPGRALTKVEKHCFIVRYRTQQGSALISVELIPLWNIILTF
jgi:hypothetical protein